MSEINLPEGWAEVQWNEITQSDGFRRGPFGGNLKKEFFIKEGFAVYEQYAPINDDCGQFRYFISEEKYLELSGFRVESGDFLISCSGTMGKITHVPIRAPAGVINQALLRIRVFEKYIDSNYFIKLFRSPEFQEKVLTKSGGGAIQNLAAVAELKQILLPLAPLAEQQQIAQKLDELLAQVDSLKTRLDAIPKILKRFRQSVLAAAVSGRLTEEWRDSNEIEYDYAEEKLSNLINEMRNGLSAKPNQQGLGVPILRISSVRSLFVDQVDVRFLELDEVEVQRYSLKPEDLLFTRYNGSLEFVGVCGQVRKLLHENLVYPDKLIRVRVNKQKIIPSYLELYYASSDVREFVMSLVKSTSGQKGISGQDLKDMNVCFPSVIEQTEIVRRVEQLFAYADQIGQRVKDAQARVNHLTQSILAKAFRGELTAQWRAQNPELISGENSAAALLERIKAEREASAKPKKKVKA